MTSAQPSEQQVRRHPVVRLAQRLVQSYARHYHHFQLLTPCPLPARGPAIVVCNHLSGLDPVLIQAVVPRPIVWMMAREYYYQPSLHWLLRLVQAIPVARSGRDLAPARAALRALSDGRILGIFPEGRIELNARMHPFQTGAALLAFHSGAPVYPAAIEGSMRDQPMLDAFLFTQRAALALGGPVDFERTHSSQELIDKATLAIRDAVLHLHRQYLGHLRNLSPS